MRLEAIGYERTNRLANDGAGASGESSLTQWVPGVGLTWAPSAALNLFGGVHRGFAPPRTEDVISQTGGVVDLEAELSWNYELGLRALPVRGLRVDATLFRNDYENQVVAASLAGGLGATLTNGGETLHEGLELGVRLDSGTLTGSRHNVFLRGALHLPARRPLRRHPLQQRARPARVSVTGNRLPYAPETAPDPGRRLLAPARAHRPGRGGPRRRAVRGRPQQRRRVGRRPARPDPARTPSATSP